MTLPPVTRVALQDAIPPSWKGKGWGKEVAERAEGLRLGDIEPFIKRCLDAGHWIVPTELHVLYDPDIDT